MSNFYSCPVCGAEVEISWDENSECPGCGAVLELDPDAEVVGDPPQYVDRSSLKVVEEEDDSELDYQIRLERAIDDEVDRRRERRDEE